MRSGSPLRPVCAPRASRSAATTRADVLSPDGTSDDGLPQSSLAELLAAGNDVRIPPYSLGDASELVEGRDFPLMRAVLGEFGCARA